jgi:hypothetical protein
MVKHLEGWDEDSNLRFTIVLSGKVDVPGLYCRNEL